jgi:hypothetical protein
MYAPISSVKMLIIISYDYNDIITVLVGADELQVTLHKDVICAKSKFFQAACSSRWREGVQKIVRLPEVRRPHVFRTYVDWTYSGELVFEDQTNEKSVLTELIDLYLLGDMLDDVKLRNMTIQTLTSQVATTDWIPGCSDYNLIWENTTSNSPLRRWALDTLVALLDIEALERNIANYPADLTQQIAVKFMHQIPDRIITTEGYISKSLDYMEPTDDGCMLLWNGNIIESLDQLQTISLLQAFYRERTFASG